MLFDSLFSPITIGKVQISNRFAMAPMRSGFATEDGLVTPEMEQYYERRARGGAGLVIVENAAVDFFLSRQDVYCLAADSEMGLPGLGRLARVIKNQGARALLQLNHAGGAAKQKITGFPAVGPSSLTSPQGEPIVALSQEDIDRVVQLFAAAAERATRAGFDGVEIQAGHGYLLAEFLSPHFNHRQDKYNGNGENRARLLLEILKAVRGQIGLERILSCRLNAEECGITDGVTVKDAQATAALIDGIVDCINVTRYGYGTGGVANFVDTPGLLIPLSRAIKEMARVPIIAVGRLSPQTANDAISRGYADMVAIGRGLIADPDFPNKIRSGNLDEIRPCIACFYCHDVGHAKLGHIACSVNATVGDGRHLDLEPSDKPKRVAVIGGGPAGMEAARVLALRKHEVTLLEREDDLGGQLRLAMKPPHKQDRLLPLIEYYRRQLTKLKAEVRLNTEADIEMLRGMAPDVIILAAGSVPLMPPIPGIGSGNVVTAFDVLSGLRATGEKVAVIGGGSTGCETAHYLHAAGKRVVVIERLPSLAMDMGPRDRTRLMSRLADLPIESILGAVCQEIRANGVVYLADGEEHYLEVDTIVIAVGSRPQNQLFRGLRNDGFEVYLAGDCRRIGRIADAVSDALRLACLV